MVYGDYLKENIQLNEESVWAGTKINNNNPQAAAHLGEIQQAIFKQEYAKAFDLANKCMVGTPPQVRSYQPLGNLFINYQWKGQPTSYKRSLDLHTGIAKTEFTIDGNTVVQEVFANITSTGFNLHVKKIVLLISGATDYKLDLLNSDPSIDPMSICNSYISNAAKYNIEELKEIHTNLTFILIWHKPDSPSCIKCSQFCLLRLLRSSSQICRSGRETAK